MRTRTRLLGAILPLALTLAAVTPVLADTTGGGGGNADLGLEAIAVTSTGVSGKTGIATVSGTISCSQDIEYAFVGVQIDQVVGRFHTLRGFGGTVVSCAAADGTASWTLTIQPEQGKYANGRATLSAFAEVDLCGDEDCLVDAVGIGPDAVRLGH